MSRLAVRAVFRVHPGHRESFCSLVERIVARVRENEPGTTRYDWYVQGDGDSYVVLEEYESSEAVLLHMQNVGPLLGEIFAAASLEVEIYGEPSEALRTATAQLEPAYFRTFAKR